MSSEIPYTINPLLAKYGKDYKLDKKRDCNKNAYRYLKDNPNFVPADDWVYKVGERNCYDRKGSKYEKGLEALKKAQLNVTKEEFEQFTAHSTFCVIKECCGKKLVERLQPKDKGWRMHICQKEVKVLGDVDDKEFKIILKNGKVIHKIADITTLHPWAWYGMIWVVPSDLIVQMPEDLLKTDKMLYYTVHHSYSYDNDGYHRCQLKIYSESIETSEPSKKKIKCKD